MDEDLEAMTHAELVAEARRLRQGIREHRDGSGHELCWHHPALWGLLPEKTDPQPVVPAWPQFMRGCIRYRQSQARDGPGAPVYRPRFGYRAHRHAFPPPRPAMNARDLARSLLPPILLHGYRGARRVFAARHDAAAQAGGDEWRPVTGGVLAGHELRLPRATGPWVQRMLSGGYEPVFTRVLAETVRAGDVCFDLGAHVGYYALVMAQRAGPGGQVHAFEPYPPSASRLRDHAARNARPAERAPVHVHQAAAGGETGIRDLVGAGDGDSVSTLAHLEGTRGVLNAAWRGRFADFERQAVRVWRLDEWRASTGAPPPTLVKIDVEGSELDVLRGARETLAVARPVVIAELHNAGLAAECGAFLGALGYAVEVVACETGGDCVIRAVHPGSAEMHPAERLP